MPWTPWVVTVVDGRNESIHSWINDWIVHIHGCTCKNILVNIETSRSCGNQAQQTYAQNREIKTRYPHMLAYQIGNLLLNAQTTSSVIQQVFFNHKHILYWYIMVGRTRVLIKISIPSFYFLLVASSFHLLPASTKGFFSTQVERIPTSFRKKKGIRPLWQLGKTTNPSRTRNCILHWNQERDMNKRWILFAGWITFQIILTP